MRSSNPIFSRWGAARDAGPADAYAQRPVGAAVGGRPADDYATNPYAPGADTSPQTAGIAVTMDDVIVRTGTTLGTVLAPAARRRGEHRPLVRHRVGAALVAFVLSLVQSFKRTPSPVLILGYAAFEGVFLGVLSGTISTYIAPGVVVQAVLGTFAVSAGVLVAYRMRWIRVTQRFTGFVAAAATGFLLLLVADLLFSAFGADDGLGFHSGGLGILFGLAGILLGAAFLALDFKQVEDAVAYGAPREEAWLAAFGLTTTLVWIYLEVLRVLTIFNSDN
ncbi:membrane protein [Streptomyces spinoverrucosus]|uniref:Membrane protein n=1 Tax=Streptomyces spinoverrucosus TaxID=284043 RepID=A0A4Y3VAZ2_9ACTN|nr:Bax inhibitor-1/YccA family protein [Streptomyces spinoverrucosus]GEC02721.1 membrane protein [Streptomyces spinoverrucosus]GHB40945.1 membrane protein [Streptomyces spinoverrucosus]